VDILEMEIINDDSTFESEIDFSGEYVSGATGEEYQKGYNKGYESGETEGYNKGFDNGLERGFEDGKNSVVNFGEYSTVIKFNDLNLFGRKEVTLNLNNVTSFGEVIRAMPISQGGVPNTTLEHLTLNCPNKITSMYYLIGGDASRRESTLKHLTLNVDTQNVGAWNYCFRWAETLEIIDGTPLDFSSATNVSNTFYGCMVLKEVRFAPNSLKLSLSLSNSNLLSADSIQSIIDGLADLTGQPAQTLDFHADIVAKLTEEQWVQITDKNWSVL
jgi:hypothetical protein